MRLGYLILNLFAVYENAYYSENYGVFGEIELEQTKFRACDEYNRAIRLGFTIPFRLMTADYRKHLETNC